MTTAQSSYPEYVNELTPELVSIHAINCFVDKNAPARCVMLAGHFSQRPVLLDGEPLINQSGICDELGKYTFDVRMPEDGTIVQVIHRYDTKAIVKDTIKFNPETIVIYRRHSDGAYDYFSIPYYMTKSTTFGYPLTHMPAEDSIHPGAMIDKDTVFARSPAVQGESHYTFSINANVAIMSHRGATLDGYVVNEDILKRYRTKIYETRSVNFGANAFLLNLNGTREDFKGFPEIGDYTRADGLVLATRRLDTVFSPATMSRDDVMEVDYLTDKRVYGRQQIGRIVDIKVVRSNNVNYNLSDEMTGQLYKYSRALTRFYQQIVDFENKITQEAKRHDRLAGINVSEKLNALMVYARGMTNQPNPDSPQTLTYTHRTEPLDAWRVELVIEYDYVPNRGAKFTGMHGDKGVICTILPAEMMPRDRDGNVADFITSPDSIPGRMNLGRPYELFYSAAARDVRRQILEEMGFERTYRAPPLMDDAKEVVRGIPEDKYVMGCALLLKYYSIISSRQAYEFGTLMTPEERIHELARIMQDRWIINYLPIDHEERFDEVVVRISQEFNLVYGPVTFKDTNGDWVETAENVRIGPMAMMMLDKIADLWLAVDTGKFSNFGTLTGGNKATLWEQPWKAKAPRNGGETELRSWNAHGNEGRELVAEIVDRNGSVEVQRAIAAQILTRDNPGDIEEIVDRNIYPLGNTRQLQIFHHRMFTAGVELVYEPEENPTHGGEA